MFESSKANQRRAKDPLWHKVFQGVGLDIGCGDDPVTSCGLFPQITRLSTFDKQDGDAGRILAYAPEWAPEHFDFVYSSHCLEHLDRPFPAICEWADLVKPGGYLAVVVPDADLYEQGFWPSRFNGEHKFMWSLHRAASDKMMNVPQFLQSFVAVKPFVLQHLRLADTNYDYSLLGTGTDQTMGIAEANIEFVLRKLPK